MSVDKRGLGGWQGAVCIFPFFFYIHLLLTCILSPTYHSADHVIQNSWASDSFYPGTRQTPTPTFVLTASPHTGLNPRSASGFLGASAFAYCQSRRARYAFSSAVGDCMNSSGSRIQSGLQRSTLNIIAKEVQCAIGVPTQWPTSIDIKLPMCAYEEYQWPELVYTTHHINREHAF